MARSPIWLIHPGREVDVASHQGIALVVGPGSVTIGEGGYPQYIAARACSILRRGGLRVLVLENNPATLMDSGGDSEDLYMEPATAEVVKRVAEETGVGTVWYGLAGSRGFLLGLQLEEEGWHEALSVRTPDLAAGKLCGNRYLVRQTLKEHGLDSSEFCLAANLREGQDASQQLDFPLVVRPDFSSAGWGCGLAYNLEEYPTLLGDALRESPTGRVIIEQGLTGWRKYIVLALRDREGRTVCPGIIEQVDALPRHDGDSIMACPAVSLSKGQAEGLREMGRKAGQALGLAGLCEFKICLSPQGDYLHLLDLNFGPGRHTPIFEAVSGTDLVRIHLDLAMGKGLEAEHLRLEKTDLQKAILVVPRLLNEPASDEGYLRLGSRAIGRSAYFGESPQEAGMAVFEALSADEEEDTEHQLMAIKNIMQAPQSRRRNRHPKKSCGGDQEKVFCLSREIENKPGGLLIVAPKGWGAGGCELETNLFHALQGWKENNGRALLYTPNLDFALFSLERSDAVFLGPLRISAIRETAQRQGLREVVLHFAGREVLSMAEGLCNSGITTFGFEIADQVSMAGMNQRLKQQGLQLVDSMVTSGFEAGMGVLGKTVFPLHAVLENKAGTRTERLLYSREDGELLLRELPDEQPVTWREVPEDVQEIQVEAVAGTEPEDLILLWEQLDEIGISASDGLGVYPPFYLTSQQRKRTTALVREVIAALRFKGNLSAKIFLRNGDSWIEEVSLGASPNLPFIERASGLPLAAIGMSILKEGPGPEHHHISGCSVVRMPSIPYGVIAYSDILPSPQRRSTGSVLGIASNPAAALAKALWSQGIRPQAGRIAFLSVANREKRRAVLLARELQQAGYCMMATRGTAHALAAAGVKVETVNKLKEGRPNILDHIRNGEVGLVINIPRGKSPHSDGFYIRAASARHGIPCITNIEFALALTRGLRHSEPNAWEILPLAKYSGLKQGIMEG